METPGFRRVGALRSTGALRGIGAIACACLLSGCVVPATSVRYGQVVSDPNVYYDPAPLAAPVPLYDPPVYYGGAPAVVAPAPIIIDRPVYAPWYPVAPVYRGHYHRYRVDPPHHPPPGAHHRGFRGDRGGRGGQPGHDARPPQPRPIPGIRSSGGARNSQPGGPTRIDSGENSGP